MLIKIFSLNWKFKNSPKLIIKSITKIKKHSALDEIYMSEY